MRRHACDGPAEEESGIKAHDVDPGRGVVFESALVCYDYRTAIHASVAAHDLGGISALLLFE